MIISMLVAQDQNRLIGANNRIPWRLPDDMVWFRQRSMGKPVIMGRKTFDSIPAKYRPLPGRHNIVLTRNPEYKVDGLSVVHSVEAALAAAGEVEEVIIAGGTMIYTLFMPHINKIYLTQVHGRFQGDTYLPEIDFTDWQETYRQHHPADERHSVSFDWIILEKPPEAC